MKKIITVVILLISSHHLFATYSVDWSKPADTYYKSGTMIARDSSDNVIVTGFTATSSIYTRKYDKFGNLMWEKSDTTGINSNYEKPGWVNVDKKNNIYVVGYRYSIGSNWEYPNAVVIIKYDASGNKKWKRNIALSYVVGSSTGLAFNLRSEIDSKNNLYIGTAGTSPSGFVLIKLNSSGTILFNVTHNFSSIHGFTGMRLKGNKLVLTGTASYNQNLATVAFDTAGNYLWSDLRTGFSSTDAEIDGNGNSYILTSYPNLVSPTSGQDIVIHKFNSSGSLLATFKYDFGGTELSTRMTLVGGKISVIGYGTLNGSYLDWITFQIKTNGIKLWDVRYNQTTYNDERPRWITAKNNGDVFVCGQGGPPPSGGMLSNLSYVVIKYNSAGIMQWLDTSAYNYGGIGIAATLAKDSSLYVLGYSSMTVTHYLDYNGTGSCGVPAAVTVSNITSNSASISWPAVSGAYLYHLRYKTSTASIWTTISTNTTNYTLTNLTGGTPYNYSVEAICTSGPSGYNATQTFNTTGAGYCTSGGISTSQDALGLVWIGSIQVGYTGANGYYDLTNLSTSLTIGSTQTGYVSGGGVNNKFFCIWIDYNHNNSFNDAGELVWQLNSTATGWLSVSFVVPNNALTGATRMRVILKRDSLPSSCGSYSFGQTEDFSVNIVTPFAPGKTVKIFSDETISNTENEFEFTISPNPVNDELIFDLSLDLNSSFEIFDGTGRSLMHGSVGNYANKLDVSNLKAGLYFITITNNLKTIQTKFLKL